MRLASSDNPWSRPAYIGTVMAGIILALVAKPGLATEANTKEEVAALTTAEASSENIVDDVLVNTVFVPRARSSAPRRPETRYMTGETLAEQVHCLALNIYFEARSETYRGRKAVAAVTINRLQSARFPKTICEVVRQGGDESLHRCQFSWWCDGRSDQPRDARSWRSALRLAESVLRHGINDPTQGALWYHADYVQPVWRREKRRVAVIGRHIFYVDKRSRARTVVEARR